MSAKFEPFRPLKTSEIFGDLFEEDDDEGISPADAGIEDASAAMAPAKKILQDTAKALKMTKAA